MKNVVFTIFAMVVIVFAAEANKCSASVTCGNATLSCGGNSSCSSDVGSLSVTCDGETHYCTGS